jgi:hypothetical protein
MFRLEKDWKKLNQTNRLVILPDEPYRTNVIDDCFKQFHRPISAVDRVIRNILADPRMRISAFVTFNPGDFADVCSKFKRELIC